MKRKGSFCSHLPRGLRNIVVHQSPTGGALVTRNGSEGRQREALLRRAYVGQDASCRQGRMPSGIVRGQPRRRLCALGAVPKTGRRTSGLGCACAGTRRPRAATRSRLPQLELQRVLAPGFVSGASRAASARLARCPAADQGCRDSACKSGRLPCFLPGVGRLPCFHPRLGNGRIARPNNVKTTLRQR